MNEMPFLKDQHLKKQSKWLDVKAVSDWLIISIQDTYIYIDRKQKRRSKLRFQILLE